MQFGYHLAELNAPQDVITCKGLDPLKSDCIPMGPEGVGVMNSMCALGIMAGSMVAGPFAGRFGRKKMLLLQCIALIFGPIYMSKAASLGDMSIGRFIAGVGSGSAVVVTPIYVSEVSPASKRGLFGAMSQLSVNLGILLTQTLGVFYANEFEWRKILFAGGMIGLINAILLPFFVIESPKWLVLNGMVDEAKIALAHLRPAHAHLDEEIAIWKTSHERSNQQEGEEEQTLLDGSDNDSVKSYGSQQVGLYEFCVGAEYRRPLMAVVGIMVIQQLCGINSIVFYGVSILSSTLPTYSAIINVGISLLNCIVTASAAKPIDKYGRRPLLYLSTAGMGITSLLLTAGLLLDWGVLASLAAAAFVVSFASGLGPIPFLIVSELTPPQAVGIAQSVATVANGASTFLIGLIFPILKAGLGDCVFLVFTLTCLVSLVYIRRFIPETKGFVSAHQVWTNA
ncbi:vacuolar protein sorting-associated protein 73 [Trichomonascus vanleenenianus]|uniref:Vvs1p n=1 Tax=Trichomonascus vanleenenianus TaxID=2268995 RepID=UPI003ECB4DBA